MYFIFLSFDSLIIDSMKISSIVIIQIKMINNFIEKNTICILMNKTFFLWLLAFFSQPPVGKSHVGIDCSCSARSHSNMGFNLLTKAGIQDWNLVWILVWLRQDPTSFVPKFPLSVGARRVLLRPQVVNTGHRGFWLLFTSRLLMMNSNVAYFKWVLQKEDIFFRICRCLFCVLFG